HTPDCMLPGQNLPCDAAGVVQLLQRHGFLVRRDLEHGVGARVDDPLARLLMLLAELLDDLGAARRLVAEHAAPRAVHERVDHLVGEPEGIRRHCLRCDDAHQLPVTGRRVLATGSLDKPARDRGRARLRRATLERLDVAEPERLERGQIEPADRARNVPERVRAFVAELGSIWKLSGSHCVEDDHARSRHQLAGRRFARAFAWAARSARRSRFAISGYPTFVKEALGLVGIAVFIAVMLALSAGVTWLVVRLSPSPAKKQQKS